MQHKNTAKYYRQLLLKATVLVANVRCQKSKKLSMVLNVTTSEPSNIICRMRLVLTAT